MLTELTPRTYHVCMGRGGRCADPRVLDILARQKRENRRATERLEARRSAAWAEAERLARAFAEADPALKRVILFGSLAQGERFTESSDIDLVIEGGDFTRLMRIAEASRFVVDLVPFETLRDGIKVRVVSEGVVLYEAKR